jgi:hypothetical protein
LFGHRPLASALPFFLSQQSFGYGPRAKRSRSATRAGLAGYLFEATHNAIAPIWQPGAYIRSRELGSVVEGAHSHVARQGWLLFSITSSARISSDAGMVRPNAFGGLEIDREPEPRRLHGRQISGFCAVERGNVFRFCPESGPPACTPMIVGLRAGLVCRMRLLGGFN